MKFNALFIIIFFIVLSTQFSKAQIQFAPYINIETQSWPEVVDIEDINNDELKDVVLGMRTYGNSLNDYTILVFIQNTNGTLNSPISYPYNSTSIGISSIDINDMNNDGLNDVIIGYDQKIGVFFQNNSGTLNPIYEINTNLSINSIKTKDINNDGLSDIITGTSGNSFKIYYQSNNGTFNGVTITKPSLNFNEVEIDDINNDQKPDLVFCSKYSNSIYVFYQNGTGSYDNYTTLNLNLTTGGISVGDLNNDGLKDVGVTIYGNFPNSKIAVLFQNPNTNLLDSAILASAFDCPEPSEINDLNNDGSNEIIAVHGGWMKLSVFEQNATFFSPYSLFNIPYASHYNNQGVSIGDINNDGGKDIAIADYNYGLVILYNTSTLGTSEYITDNNNFFIYPNPVLDSFSVKNDSKEVISFNISDINGKKLLSGNTNSDQSIDISYFQSGLYFLTLNEGSNKKIYKIVKQ